MVFLWQQVEQHRVEVATGRIARLVHLSAVTDKPASLRLLDSICFIEKSDSQGILRRIPERASGIKQPVSLYSLLRRDPEAVTGFRAPALEERLRLAQQLAASIYSFGVVRWFHKDFNCRNVIFFRDCSSSSQIMFDSPYVTGLSIARPDNGGKSLNKDLDALAIYLHPDLRVAEIENRPPYHRKYDVYSLGLMLFEIGIWTTIDKIPGVGGTLGPADFKKHVVDRCNKDLAFFIGRKYRDVVLHCLTCADEDKDESASSLDTLYEYVLLELAKC
jgi:hypothetical protein